MKKSFFIILFIVMSLTSFSQSKDEVDCYTDSILRNIEIEDLINKDLKIDEDYYEIIKLSNEIIENDSLYVKAYFYKSMATFYLEDYRGALIDINTCIELVPNDEFLYLKRGVVFGVLKDHESAIKDYTKCIDLDKNNSECYYNRGLSRYIIRDYDNACFDWSRAGDLGLTKAYENIKEGCNN